MIFFLLAAGIFGLITSTVFAGMVVAGARHHLRGRGGGGVGFFPGAEPAEAAAWG